MSQRTFGQKARRAAMFTSAGVVGGAVATCAAVHYRWQALKEEQAYTDIVRDGFARNNYIRHSFVAGQVRDSLRRRREADEQSLLLWIANRLQAEIEEAERREALSHEMDMRAALLQSARVVDPNGSTNNAISSNNNPYEAAPDSLEIDNDDVDMITGSSLHTQVHHEMILADSYHVRNCHADDYLIQHVLQRTPQSVRNLMKQVLNTVHYLPFVGGSSDAIKTTDDESFATASSNKKDPSNDGIAHCRQRLDTPEYLIPYYLRSNLSRFTYYASKKEGGKFKRMDGHEFLKALLGQPKDAEVANPHAADGLVELFKTFDTNGDGEMSFKEFSFMLTLLATPTNQFVTAFQMFNHEASDAHGGVYLPENPLKSSLNFEEFCEFIETRGDEHCKPKLRNPLMKRLFGPTGNARCTAEQMLAEVGRLKEAVWTAEFLQHVDPEEAAEEKKQSRKAGVEEPPAAITAESFGNLIYSHLLGQHLPFHMVANLRKLRKYDDREDTTKFALPTWFAFSRIMESVDTIGAAVRLYSQTTGRELNREEFSRAVESARLPKLKDDELDLLFTLFDTDGDGTIGFDEFETLAKQRIGFHVKSAIEGKGEGREHFFPTLMKCATEAIFEKN